MAIHGLNSGSGRPDDSGISLKVVSELGPHYPIFGVCMGHQCIGQAFGGRVVRAPSGVMHGKSSPVYHKSQGMLHVCSSHWYLQHAQARTSEQ